MHLLFRCQTKVAGRVLSNKQMGKGERLKTNQDKDYIELTISSSLYSKPDKKGNEKLLKSNLISKISMYVDDITAHEEVIDDNGNLVKNICSIHHQTIGPLIVRHTYSTISRIKKKENSSPKIGFNK